MTNILFILLAFGFVILNGFFVIAEFAMVRLRHSTVHTIKDKNGLQGKILYKVHNNLDTYLSACQLGITLASLGLGWIGEPAFAKLLEPLFAMIGVVSHEMVIFISFVVGFSIISFLHIVIGELMPKSLAIRQAEKWSLFTSIPLYVFYWVMFPFIWVLNASANCLLSLFKLNIDSNSDYTYTAEEIKLILKSSHLKKPLREQHRHILLHMLAFSKLQAIDVMRPLDEMVSLDFNTSIKQKLEVIQKHLYTRYPVYQNSQENIIGVLHTKDILTSLIHRDIQDHKKITLRPIVKVSHHSQAIDILNRFQQGKPHFALVYNNQQLIGFVTLDNLLRTLIGKIQDEFHLVKDHWVTLPDKTFLIKGNAPVYAIEKIMDVDFSNYPADTIADLLSFILTSEPKVGDIWEQPSFNLKITKIKNKHIKEVILKPKNSSL